MNLETGDSTKVDWYKTNVFKSQILIMIYLNKKEIVIKINDF